MHIINGLTGIKNGVLYMHNRSISHALIFLQHKTITRLLENWFNEVLDKDWAFYRLNP